jgi:shikimate dehydrogenase
MTALRFVVVGDPIDHSLSPLIHNAALRWNHIDGSYGRRRARPEDMAGIRAELLAGELHGVNVTMPNKAAARAVADEASEAARLTGSVNTLWCRDGVVMGDNTDVAGVRWAMHHAGLEDNGPVVIAGAGGAAAAALLALSGRDVVITARNERRVAELIEATGGLATAHPWGKPLGAATVVNATPIGMQGEALPEWLLDNAAGLLDMTYGDRPSPACQIMEGRGLPAARGELMLVGQAAVSFAIWTGVEPPHAVMLTALHSTQSDQ